LQKELTKRQLQTDLVRFSEYFFEAKGEKFLENWHHREIADVLQKVKEGEIKNLLINIPPRYSKTEMAVINFIAQCIAEEPSSKFIHLSYSDDLALENSGRAKEMILSEEYQELWPVKLKGDSKSKKKWYTEQGGGLYATAAGGAVTGFGAGSLADEDGKFYGAIIIDDPLKVDDADSDNERDRVNKRLNTTIKSRRNSKRTPIIIIMQRLHEDDMSGFVLDGGMGEEFYHLKLPAIYDGKPLWPAKHSMEALEAEQKSDPRTFAGQMMQEPSPDDGTFFRREWFNRYDLGDEPETYKYGAMDCAVSEPEIGKKADFTELGVAGFDNKENLWVLDWWYGQTTMDMWIDEQIRLVRKHRPMVWAAEGGIIRRASEPFMKKEMQSTGTYFRMEWIVSNKNKAANARSFQALASQGKVYIPNTPWGERLLSQLLKFPTGKWDDAVDVCGLFGRILDQTYSPRELIKATEAAPRDSYGLDEDDDESGWKTQ
jgi:predicted phage terminase large subunit-like protein